ncbi:BamA/TamA family outer membrane protein [Plebeiibacterium marinum]|uniref:BamA/TamA family outer membrane protein n=1 Tax=Plebeiibacterium marinum TaxID=2992111 RepID=A0AAE3MC55_9BACT|nr:BamA/TamA family outer membrane protein [Plebeiobacterium marinum]MCW3805203.1 BamA/TamA family outer membrane protein [Plebeiobacterium marinum]
MRRRFVYFFMVFGFLLHSNVAFAQYFGQNKPSYKQFDFEQLKTPHFEIYHYCKSDSLIKSIAQKSEQWYRFHQQVLLDTFKVRNPLLLYSSHADFQQTNAIHGYIGIGTGGVTEGFKKRIVMPLGFSEHQTNHVLGHEMVHAFQYDLLQRNSSLGLASIQNIPLWMIEGMAEYLSVGNTDGHTVLWMRDALIHNKFPSLKTMTVDYRYSPYRYGQAFWSYIANTYGEQYVSHLFTETAYQGIENAISDVLFISMDSLSHVWKESMEQHLLRNVNDSTFSVHGERILSRRNSGRYNLAPSVSPDGEKLIFLSERDLFSLDLFLADAKTGEVLKKIYTSTNSDQIDDINYMETSGTWAPDSKHFAYVAYIKGKSALVVFDVEKAKLVSEIDIPQVDAFSYPAWSPNGDYIVFTGLKEGISDLYLFEVETKEVRNITRDHYCNLQASWDKEGDVIYYITDAPSPTQERVVSTQYNIAKIDLASLTKDVIPTFDGAQNMNPVVSADGSKVFFLSDRDGTRNLYFIDEKRSGLKQVTFYPTGITGITAMAPALNISKNYLYYNMLWEGEFSILRAHVSQIQKTAVEVSDKKVDFYASRLMPYSSFPSMVDQNLVHTDFVPVVEKDSFYTEPVKAKFKLDYIGNTSMGVMTGRYGAGMAGSVEARFSDILGDHMLYTGVSINGEIYDFGGQVAYVNQKRPLKLGVSLSHIPYQTGYFNVEEDGESGEGNLAYYFRRTFIDKLSLFSYYPINKSHRIEFGISGANYSYRTEKVENYSYYYSLSNQKSKLIESPDPFAVGIFDLAYVIDNARFGLASPIEGKRIRFAYERYIHGVNMNTFLFDFRKYFRFKPYTLAYRMYHYGRYGSGSDDTRLFDVFIGYPWYVRGYESGNFYGDEQDGQISTNQLWGSKAVVSNLEWRIPFSGPRDYAWIRSQLFFSELAVFYDAGLTWDSNSSPEFSFTTRSQNKRIPVMSTGMALRFNLLGAIIIEPYYAFPIHQGKIHEGNFGINILSGW